MTDPIRAYGDGPDGLPVGRLAPLGDDAARAAAETVGIDPAYLVQPIWRVLLRRPRLAKAVYDVLTDLLFRNRLDSRLRELLIMRIGWTTRSVFEWAQHWRVASDAGVPAEDVIAVRTLDSDRLTSRDLDALAAVDEVVAEGEVSRATWTRLSNRFKEDELLEIVSIATTWTWISSLLRSLDVPLDAGMAAWPPDALDPDRRAAHE
jgi:4-carboxymuconolactone decarboxylase